MEKHTIQDRQNIFDAGLQLYGDVEQIFDFLVKNDISLDSSLRAGDVILYDDELGNENVKDFIKTEGVIYNNSQDSMFIIEEGDFNDDFDNDYLL